MVGWATGGFGLEYGHYGSSWRNGLDEFGNGVSAGYQ
jgi:hypothetical protein